MILHSQLFMIGLFRSFFPEKTQKDESEIESLYFHELSYTNKNKDKQR